MEVLPEAYRVDLYHLSQELCSRNGVVALGAVITTFLLAKLIRTQMRKRQLSSKRSAKQNCCTESLKQLEDKIAPEISDISGDIIQLNVEDLIQKMKSDELRPTEVLRAFQHKALEVNKELNCLMENIREADDQAKNLEQSSVKNGLLYGVPVSLKDNYGLKGYDSTIGCSKFIDEPYAEDAVVVKILKLQGAVPFVKTNVPQTMLSWETTNPIFGMTRNPHDPTRGVGGSSGGEASLIGGGGSIIGFGSDVGGSIRIPANMCGVYGLKPSETRISHIGTTQILKGQTCIKVSYGPLANSVDGLALAMKAVCVPEMSDLDPFVPYVPFKTEVYEKRNKLKIGFFLEDGYFNAVPAMHRAVLMAKAALEKSGHEVIAWTYPKLGEKVVHIWTNAMMGEEGEEIKGLVSGDAIDSAMQSVLSMASLPRIVRRLLSIPLGYLYPTMTMFMKASLGLGSVAKWWELVHETEEFRQSVVNDWKEKGFDAVICPGFACPALPLHKPGYASGAGSYTMLYNVLSFPAGSMPVTKVNSEDLEKMKDYQLKDLWHRVVKQCMPGSEGLPVNVQVASLPWQDEMVLRVMKEIESTVEYNKV